MLRLVIDDKIPFIREAAARLGECIFLPGAAITADDVREADVLITRTRTQVNRALLDGSKVQLVVTATIGHDHIDKAYLAEKGIAWHNCPGCNAHSVAQYVRNSLWIAAAEGCFAEGESSSCTTEGNLATTVDALGAEKSSFGAKRPTTDKNLGNFHDSTAHNVAHSKAFDPMSAPFCATLSGLTVGIVGVGHVGTAVAEILAAEGCRVLRCDPPKGEPHMLVDLAREADVISLHTPLTFEGEHVTFHLADRSFFESLQRYMPLLNKDARVSDVIYPGDLMKDVNRNIRTVSIILLIVAVLLGFVSLALINNTLRMSVAKRRDAIQTMKLVGAKWSLIRRPFLTQAFYIGLISSIVADLTLWGAMLGLRSWDEDVSMLVTPTVMVLTLIGVPAVGISLTVISAYFSVNRHIGMRRDDALFY